MVAPYFCGLLRRQSDFGNPAGAVLAMLLFKFGVTVLGDTVLATKTLRTSPQNLACGADRGICTPRRLLTCNRRDDVFTDICKN